jgi:transcription-repair coupling factor (superfamily II helicase)
MKKLTLPLPAIGHFLSRLYNKHEGDILLICSSEEDAVLYAKQAHFFDAKLPIFYFPAWDSLPFDRISPSPSVMADRARILSQLASDKREKKLVIMSSNNLLQKLPPKEEFVSSTVTIRKAQSITPDSIAMSLARNGFIRCGCANEPGEFSLRGEIVDVVISDNVGYRINFAWDKIDKIRIFDPLTQVSSDELGEIDIYPASEFNLHQTTINNFKAGFLKAFGVNYSKNPIYLAISEGRMISAAEHLLPLLYPEMIGALEYLRNPYVICDPLSLHAMKEMEVDILDFYESRISVNKAQVTNFYPAIDPNYLYFKAQDTLEKLEQMDANLIDSSDDGSYCLTPNLYSQSIQTKRPIIDLFLEFITSNNRKKIIIICPSRSGYERIKNMFEAEGISLEQKNIELQIGLIKTGFISDEIIYFSAYDILGEKFSNIDGPKKKNKKLKNILTELENLTEGELVSHQEHGVAEFAGVETVMVSGQPHDCVKLLYADNDRLYIPVENLDVIKRYGSEDAALDRLGGLSWQKRKAKLKDRIGELAQKLMKLAASRKVRRADPIIITEAYDKFSAAFPYNETEDQLTSINDIKEDLLSGHPMDRLICGDVGFGKTEVSMRGAFMVASDAKQVAVISPTTILSRQHFASFSERFRNSGLKVAQLSRLVNAKESKRVKEGLKNGEIDIVVGTHALLAKDISFHNLGLVIVDEEQRFGVAQKERLKELKTGVHILTLSATPIPRTLQMSLLGIRDLSFIATPPIDRLSVRTSVIPYDNLVVRDALLREHFRGGRSFYVAPRIKDLEELAKSLNSLVPELSYRMAHGQMAPGIIDEIMGDFYDGKFDILLCTTIIESGIDVPAAGTIIIHKAEMLGLSQLYQLRGRVGRSKSRGYAYLTISNTKGATKHAIKRLDIMQNVDSLGAGFSIASHDMDIRGFGNLVGDEQAGHIKEVGIELYQDMLEEAVAVAKGEEPEDELNPSINLGLPISMPEEYVGDRSVRIGLYRRLSSIDTKEELENFRDELVDRFGPLPISLQNLMSVIEIKQLCKKMHIESLDSGPGGFVIKFHSSYNPSEMVMGFIKANPRISKIKPDNKFVVLKTLSGHNIIAETMALFKELKELGK